MGRGSRRDQHADRHRLPVREGRATNIAPGEQITYVESWSSNRTDAEILAAQKKREAEQKAIAEERQRQFKELERRFGMDGK
jgi:hypothetical protein